MSTEKIAHRTWGRQREGLLCGALAGVLAVSVEVLLRSIAGVPSLAELLGDQGIGLLPGGLFEFLLGVFGHSAKYLYFVGLLIAQVVGLAILGGLAFSVRAFFINRRALNAVHRAEDARGQARGENEEADAGEGTLATKKEESPAPTKKAPAAVGQEGEEDAEEDGADEEETAAARDEAPDHTDYTPAERAALLGAVPRIQAPVGWRFGVALVIVTWLLSGGLVLPLLGAGPFGLNLPLGVPTVLLSLAVPALVFGASFAGIQRVLRPLAPQVAASPKLQRAFSPGRRLFLKRVTVGLIVLGAGTLAWRFITQGLGNGSAADASSLDGPPPPERITPPPTPDYGAWQEVKGETPELTANEDFYLVSKNIYSDPDVGADSWQVTINGEGAMRSLTLSYQDLLRLPATEQITTLECISNPVGGSLMSSARWKGVAMKDLLGMAGVKPGASKVVFHASDDYTDSIHLVKALDPLTLLVHTMNDAPLPKEHGFPARVIVPGIYGMKHCKWLTQIEVVSHEVLGYWQQRGWNDEAVINLGARIDVPFDGASLSVNQPTYIAGVAFGGAKGVSAVDVSTNNGRTWQRATLKQPLGAVTWTLWELPWTPGSTDTYAIVVRMIDLPGDVQQPVLAEPFPSGATGYHRIYVQAK